LRRFLPWCLLGLLLGWAALRLGDYAAVVPFDYDEVAEAHAVWQVSEGRRPYHDFYYDHAPYSWLVWAPVLKSLPEAFETLVILRLVNILLSLLVLGLLALLIKKLLHEGPTGRGSVPLVAACAAVGVMASHRSAMTVLYQFRGDQLSLAFTLLGLLLLEARPRGKALLPAAAAGFCLVSGILITPKLVLLCFLALVLAGTRLQGEDPGSLRSFCAGVLGGGLGAFGLWNVWAVSAGADPWPFYRLVVAHHWANLSESGYAFGAAMGLVESVSQEPGWFLVFLPGLAAGVLEVRRRGLTASPVLSAILLFCLIQPLWVKYPWHQYLFSVCLLWGVLLGVFFLKVWERRPAAGQVILALAVVCSAGQELRRFRAAGDLHTLGQHIAWGNEILGKAIPGRSVAIQPPFHPVFRTNATYFFNFTFNPKGSDTEAVLRGIPVFGEKFSRSGYLEQLEASPPSVVMASPFFTGKEYMAAVLEFVRARHPRSYRKERIAGMTAYVRSTGWPPSASRRLTD
jgi:hypothetical protein